MYKHFETELELDSDYWAHKLNSFLPPSIVIYRIIPVHEAAHARFDANFQEPTNITFTRLKMLLLPMEVGIIHIIWI